MKEIFYNFYFSFQINYLDLPKQITQNAQVTNYVYRADGVKVKKLFGDIETNYLDGFQYKALKPSQENPGGLTGPDDIAVMKLRIIPTAEGYFYAVMNQYIYNYTDHLGNVRLSYSDSNKDGVIQSRQYLARECSGLGWNQMCIDIWKPGEIVETNNYYPFGLMHNYTTTTQNAYQYKYNGKELQESGNLDYGWRQYMPDLGRWFNVDLKAEKSFDITPYRYSFNNPVLFKDPDGLWEIRVDNVGGRKMMTFVAQKDDNLETLAQQTGLNLGDLQKGMAGKEISEGKGFTELGVEKIDKMIDEINKHINNQKNADRSNCWGTCISFGKHRKVSFNIDDTATGVIGDPNVADEKLLKDFKQTNKPKFGDIRRYAYTDGNKRFEKDFMRYNYNQVNDGTQSGGTSHYAIFLLQNGSGTVYVFSKNGSGSEGLWIVDSESTLLGEKNGYGEPTPIGKGSPNYTRK